MNGVNWMDQLCSTNATQRKEKRIHFTSFTLFLDLAVCQAYAVFKKLSTEYDAKISLVDFKRNICEQLAL